FLDSGHDLFASAQAFFLPQFQTFQCPIKNTWKFRSQFRTEVSIKCFYSKFCRKVDVEWNNSETVHKRAVRGIKLRFIVHREPYFELRIILKEFFEQETSSYWVATG